MNLEFIFIKNLKMTHLREGDKAPDFKGINEKGDLVSLRDFKGKKLALYFYPQDNTPTCTTEACNLRDDYSILKKRGIEVLGVSPDSPRKHGNFIKKFDLPFSLIADEDLSIIKAYGIWGPKKFMGREYDGVNRTTFIIDEKGKIEKIIDKVKSKSHAQQILDALAK
ncbi:MAG TPA: thioredoxin-dependent thiol peroxidase [Saprospiraceae bacterium]|nr:thioredoxin-dependent thiol peroxidase [Saprospiraceae bacterium]